MTALPQERRVVTAIPGPKSQELQARRTAAVAQGVGSVLPVFTARAGGGIIEDVDGNRLIDFGSGIAVTSVGASAEAVVRRASAQLADFTHTCFMVTPYEGYVAVAEALAELTPGDHAKKSALFNSGAEAVENAVKIARAYTKRQAVVVFDHGYHGRTNLTMALTAKNMPYKHGFGPFAPEVYRVPVAYGYRWPTGAENAGPEAAAQAVDQMSKQVGADNIAAIIIEPVLGEGGFIEPAKGFLPAIRRFAADHGIVFVADEIQSGFCRTGQWFACEDEDIVPGPDHDGEGHRGRSAAGRRHRPRGDHGRRARGRPGRHLRRQPGGLRGRARRHRDDEGAGPQRPGAQRHRGVMKCPPDRHGGEVRRHRRRPRAAAR
ncbi:hypothetical protein GCM10019016_040200 [Streptomyces prasinosporus]|uniref:Aminotransferase class III-fold pyridoxal phosphate-dependent enzyme n=1 Tax=Streptomyces prasinosporus TaxID=68256 RepID=A0ABP6TNR4_9ACTN